MLWFKFGFGSIVISLYLILMIINYQDLKQKKDNGNEPKPN